MNKTSKPLNEKVISSFIEIFGENFIHKHGKQIVETNNGKYLFEARTRTVKLFLEEIEIEKVAKYLKCREWRYLGRWEFKTEFVNVKHNEKSDVVFKFNGIDCRYDANDLANALKVIGNVVDIYCVYNMPVFKEKGELILVSNLGSVIVFWMFRSLHEEAEREAYKIKFEDVAILIKGGDVEQTETEKVVEENADDNEDLELIKELEGELGITVKFPVF
jgi:hypothetical protein